MTSESRALALTAAGVIVVAGGGAGCHLAFPDRPALLALPIALGAVLFLLGVRRFVKPARTGEEER